VVPFEIQTVVAVLFLALQQLTVSSHQPLFECSGDIFSFQNFRRNHFWKEDAKTTLPFLALH